MQTKFGKYGAGLAVGVIALALAACNSSNPTPAAEAQSADAPQSVVATPAESGAPSNDALIEAVRTAKIAAARDPAQQEGFRTASITPRGACTKSGDAYDCPVNITMELETGASQTNETAQLTQDAAGKWVVTMK